MYEDQDVNLRLYKGYTLQRTNPYGLWIVLDQKARPIIEGSFTTTSDAVQALNNYLDNQAKTKKAS